MNAEKKLAELGLTLPEAPNPIASFVTCKRQGKLLYKGKVGGEVTPEQANEAARAAMLNHLATMKKELGDLDKVKQIVKLLGFVACADGFYAQPKVINGASDLLIEVFGEKGRHARSAIGVYSLPSNMPVEIEMIVEVED